MPDKEIIKSVDSLIGQVAEKLNNRNFKLATAESCTGGLIAALCTGRPGSSDWFRGGVVVYSNELKQKLLGVPEDILLNYGAVSGETVRLMAAGALEACLADVSVAVSGIAGPSGGTEQKPVGTVWLAWARAGLSGPEVTARLMHFDGGRDEVRQKAALAALEGLLVVIEE